MGFYCLLAFFWKNLFAETKSINLFEQWEKWFELFFTFFIDFECLKVLCFAFSRSKIGFSNQMVWEELFCLRLTRLHCFLFVFVDFSCFFMFYWILNQILSICWNNCWFCITLCSVSESPSTANPSQARCDLTRSVPRVQTHISKLPSKS